MSEISPTFIETLHEQGIHFLKGFCENNDNLKELWNIVRQLTNQSKYELHKWIIEYEINEDYDYDYDEVILSEFIEMDTCKKQFIQRLKAIINDYALPTSTNYQNSIKTKIDELTNSIKISKKNLKKIKNDLHVLNFIKHADILTGIKPVENIIKEYNTDDEEDEDSNDDNYDEDEYDVGYQDDEYNEEDYQKFFSMVPQMTNISITETYKCDCNDNVDAKRTVSFNNNYSFSILYNGNLYECCKTYIEIKTLNNNQKYNSFNTDTRKGKVSEEYIEQLKEIINLFGFDGEDIAMFNKYIIHLMASRKSDDVSFMTVYPLFSF